MASSPTGEHSLALESASPDTELQDRFFKSGLSHDVLMAESERGRDEDVLIGGQKRAQKIVAGGVVVVLVPLLIMAFGGSRPPRGSSKAEAAPTTVVRPRAAPAARPSGVALAPLTVVAATPPMAVTAPVVAAPASAAPAAAAPAVPAAAPAAAAPAVAAPAIAAPAVATPAVAAPAVAAPALPARAAAAAPAAAAPAVPTAAPAVATTAAPAAAPAAARLKLPLPGAGAGTPGADDQALRDACLRTTPKTRYKDLVDNCAAAFAARPAADVATLLAQQALERGRNGDAATWAQKAIDADPAAADAFVLLGGAEQELGHRGEARAAYRRYLELAPRGKHAADIAALLRSL